MFQETLIELLDKFSLEPETIPEGSLIFKKNQSHNNCLVLREGEVFLSNSDINLSQEHVRERRLWGVKELVLEKPFAFDLIAKTEISVSFISKTELANIFKENYNLKRLFLKCLAKDSLMMEKIA